MKVRTHFDLFGLAIVAGLLLATLGCGGSGRVGANLKVTPVSGKVTLGGEPLADAQVTLAFEGNPPDGFVGAGAKTDAQGNFEVFTGGQKGAPAGTYKVVISKLVGADGKPAVPSEGMDMQQIIASGAAKELVPGAYSEEVQVQTKVTVKDGTPTPPVNIDIPKQ